MILHGQYDAYSMHYIMQFMDGAVPLMSPVHEVIITIKHYNQNALYVKIMMYA